MAVRIAVRMNVAEGGATQVTVATYDAAGAREGHQVSDYASPAEAVAALAKGFGEVPPPPRHDPEKTLAAIKQKKRVR